VPSVLSLRLFVVALEWPWIDVGVDKVILHEMLFGGKKALVKME
jgi:hypothetical protein